MQKPRIIAYMTLLLLASCASHPDEAWRRGFPTDGLAMAERGAIDIALSTEDWLEREIRGRKVQAEIFQISDGIFIPDNERTIDTGMQRYALSMEEPSLRIERVYRHANRNLRERRTVFVKLPEGIDLSWNQESGETPLPALVFEGSVEGHAVRVFATRAFEPPAFLTFMERPGFVELEWATGYEAQVFQVLDGSGVVLAELDRDEYRLFDSCGTYDKKALRDLLVIVRASSRFASVTEDYVARQRSAVSDGKPLPSFPYRYEGD